METEKIITHSKEYPLNLMTDLYKICCHPSEDILYSMTEDQSMALNAVLGTLDDRYRDIMILHYKHGETYKDIAAKFNISAERVRQIRNKIFRIISRPHNYTLIKNGYVHSMNIFITTNAHYGINGNHAPISDNSLLELSINNLELSARCLNALTHYGTNIIYIKDLISMKPADIRRIRNLGIKSIKEINEKLESMGIHDTAWNFLSRENDKDENN